jgi:hypothetical protein
MFGRRLHRCGRGSGSVLILVVSLVGLASCGGGSGTEATTPSSATPTSVSPSSTNPPAPTPASWRRISPSPIRDDYYAPAQAVWDGNEMLVVVTQSDPTSFCKETVFAYEPSSDRWQMLSRVPTPKGCFEGSDKAVWTGQELLLWGISNTAYDPAADTWRHLPDPPTGDGGPSVVVWTGKQMIGWGGGCCDQQLADGAAYTPATDSWKVLPPSPLAGRHAAGVWTGTEMIIAGGSGGPDAATGRETRFADAAAYSPSTGKWRKLPAMPVTRGGQSYTLDYTAVWDGTEMILVGGRPMGGNRPLSRGVAYDPSTNGWRWLPPMETARDGFVSAWAGDQLVVWGGVAANGAIPPHGETYDPAANVWSALPKAPLRARVAAVAVWSGAELIIWGGLDARTLNADRVTSLTDGAALTPSSA